MKRSILKKAFETDYYLWGMYKGVWLILDLPNEMTVEELHSAVYGEWYCNVKNTSDKTQKEKRKWK